MRFAIIYPDGYIDEHPAGSVMEVYENARIFAKDDLQWRDAEVCYFDEEQQAWTRL